MDEWNKSQWVSKIVLGNIIIVYQYGLGLVMNNRDQKSSGHILYKGQLYSLHIQAGLLGPSWSTPFLLAVCTQKGDNPSWKRCVTLPSFTDGGTESRQVTWLWSLRARTRTEALNIQHSQGCKNIKKKKRERERQIQIKPDLDNTTDLAEWLNFWKRQ